MIKRGDKVRILDSTRNLPGKAGLFAGQVGEVIDVSLTWVTVKFNKDKAIYLIKEVEVIHEKRT